MLIESYKPTDLGFAYCYHVYYRFGTLRRRAFPQLACLSLADLQQIADRFDIHILESSSEPTDLLLLASLKPTESVSICASKLKGQISKWLRIQLGQQDPMDLLKSGYFACTSGKSTREQIDEYLGRQGEHHGYTDRAAPPLFVKEFQRVPEIERGLAATHAVTELSFHLVLATWWRRGVFTQDSVEIVSSRWAELQIAERFALRKVSFVPDHVHVTIGLHPASAPGSVAANLMNTAQEVMFKEFSESVIRAKIERLWQPNAYVGSFGDLSTPMIQQFVRDWKNRNYLAE